jgi:hypothetical protein
MTLLKEVLKRLQGLPGLVRKVSQTLRWTDIEFMLMKGGIAMRINFFHTKGYRDPYKANSQHSDAKRTFLLVPPLDQTHKQLTDLTDVQFPSVNGRAVGV